MYKIKYLSRNQYIYMYKHWLIRIIQDIILDELTAKILTYLRKDVSIKGYL